MIAAVDLRPLQQLAEIGGDEVGADLLGTSFARSGFFSARPMKSTFGWRAATSPRNRPTRPPPTIARPMRFGFFFGMRRQAAARFAGAPQREIDRRVALGRQVGGDVDLHHHARVLRRHQHRPVVDHRLEEVHRLRRHRPGVGVLDRLARHGRHRQLHALLHRVQHHVAVGVVDDHRALGADHLDPGGGEVRIARRQAPAAADHEGEAAVHRDRDPLRVGNVGAGRLPHRAEVHLRVHAHRLGRLEAPQHEVEVVRRLHRRRRELRRGR